MLLLSPGANLVSDSRLSFGRQSHQSLLVGEIFLLAGKWSLYSILARTGDLQLYCLLAEIHKLFLLATKHLLLLTFECWIYSNGEKSVGTTKNRFGLGLGMGGVKNSPKR